MKSIFKFEFSENDFNRIVSNDEAIKILVDLTRKGFTVRKTGNAKTDDAIEIMKTFNGIYWEVATPIRPIIGVYVFYVIGE